jgi:peptidoglycan hydrolase-like protein with peptidoglycan-binding domain
MCHHTATNAPGNMPSLRLLIEGRSDLAGPLAQLGLGRDGTFYIIAAGRANHAGAGQWEGIATGNSSFIGIEAENDGVNESWPAVQMDAYQRGVAAILKKIGAGANMCCGHKEYASPQGRKTDPDFDMPAFRREVAAFLSGKSPSEPIPAVDAQSRLTLRRGNKGEAVAEAQKLLGVGANGFFDANTEAALRAFQRKKNLVPDGILGPKSWAALLSGKVPEAPAPGSPPPTAADATGKPGSPPPGTPTQRQTELPGKREA